MMHDHEKSDSAIVATKPTNKTGIPAAESAEPRAETKGNANQQSTRRAQDRESVSQALERVRNAAKQRKKERFTALFHHLSPAMLRTAGHADRRSLPLTETNEAAAWYRQRHRGVGLQIGRDGAIQIG
jgi:RNA-directed DNA polymerase